MDFEMKSVMELRDDAKKYIDNDSIRRISDEDEESIGFLRAQIVKLHEAQSPWDSETVEDEKEDAKDIMRLYKNIENQLESLQDDLTYRYSSAKELEARNTVYEQYILKLNKKIRALEDVLS